MELGIGMFGDVYYDPSTGNKGNVKQRLKDVIAQGILADEVGLDVIELGEHHRSDYVISNPEIALAALASTTKNIKLASGVTVLSSADPVRVFENFSMIDLIADGRSEIVVGRGSFIESFPLYGFDLNHYDALFEEKLHLLLQLNQEKVINWQGKFRAPLYNQEIHPRTEQKNGIPIWIAVGGTPASVIRAASLGLPLIIAIIGGMPYQFRQLTELYKRTYLEHGHDESAMQLAVHMHTVIGDDKHIQEEYFPYYAQQMNAIGKDRGWSPYTKAQYDYGTDITGHLLVGDTNLVIDKILQYKEWFGITRFTAQIDVGGPSHSMIMKTIELLGSKVLPAIKDK